MQTVKLFPKVIGYFKNPDLSEHNNIVKKCYNIKNKISSGGENWLSGVYNTCGKINLYHEKEFKPLLDWIDTQVIEYVDNLKIKFNTGNKEAWFQIYGRGDYQDYHTHPTSPILMPTMTQFITHLPCTWLFSTHSKTQGTSSTWYH